MGFFKTALNILEIGGSATTLLVKGAINTATDTVKAVNAVCKGDLDTTEKIITKRLVKTAQGVVGAVEAGAQTACHMADCIADKDREFFDTESKKI